MKKQLSKKSIKSVLTEVYAMPPVQVTRGATDTSGSNLSVKTIFCQWRIFQFECRPGSQSEPDVGSLQLARSNASHSSPMADNGKYVDHLSQRRVIERDKRALFITLSPIRSAEKMPIIPRTPIPASKETALFEVPGAPLQEYPAL